MSLVRVNLLYMSIYGGILILTVLSLRLLLKNRLPRNTRFPPQIFPADASLPKTPRFL